MVAMQQTTRLTPIQLDVLKMFSRGIPDDELIKIKRILAAYFANKLTAEADRIWEEKGLTDDDMDKWLKELS